LNTLSDFEFIDLERVTWDDCNLNNGDCLTPKGFTFLRAKVSDGLWVDVYNMHTDAGSDSGDMDARQSNLNQVANFVAQWSVGFPVVIMGDTNSRYTTTEDSASLHSLIDSAGLTDAWVQIIRGGSFPTAGTDALVCPFPFPSGTSQATMVACEVVDKILVRGNAAATLAPQTFTNENDAFVNSSGDPLSDHYPISSTLGWTLSSSLRVGDSLGGPHGDTFNDISSSVISSDDNVPSITSITLQGASRLDAVSYTLEFPDGSTQTITHGGSGGDASTLSLDGDYVTSITLCQGQFEDHTRIFSAEIETNGGQTLSAGTSTSDCATFTVPTDPGSGGSWGLVGFWGRSGDEVDRLAAIWGAVY
jgi:endonuclease/exonuclease/phosphatase family metal-dependent hydrolase